MLLDKIEIKEYRNERKFLLSGISKQQLKSFIRLHPAGFKKAYPNRYINNIYFDSFEYNNFQEHVNGVQSRSKIRMRWYAEMFGEIRAQLELKQKNGSLSGKAIWELVPFTLSPGVCSKELGRLLLESSLPNGIKTVMKKMIPVNANRYVRQYYICPDKSVRITIDSNLEYFDIKQGKSSFMYSRKETDGLILELKYPPTAHVQAAKIASAFPFCVFRSSKYISGLRRMNTW